MPSDRQAVLQLIALGRIDPVQAERLLAIVNEERENLLALAGSLAVAMIAELHAVVPGLMQHMQSAFSAGAPRLQHVFTSIALLWGGNI
jgi:hypothetical protein